ncbi:hypothetical protein AUR64_06860 [Haloprofundus marisrubri]|uniref:Right handed beta helix domain-containing protein n=1 Tax=Haloprofundus marisrubri TaxID=1514971 RepID=A0A0W1RBW1_9EURY|nr:hypothetical protein [Haloprofundus marisrubri]KTG10896.1 hypothetical protein AUR64_06860 [Haloprofundus marisrubri]
MQNSDIYTESRNDDDRTQTAEETRSTGRRPFLRGVGATIAAAGGLGTAGAAAADPSTSLKAVGDGFYSFRTSGEIVDGGRANTDKEDVIDGQSANGEVANNGTDSYYFAGELTALDADDGVTVTVDGDEVDPSEFDSTDAGEGRGDTPDEEEQAEEADDEEEVGGNEYETIVVDAGETHDERVWGGETLENVLYDITADGAALNIDASGTDWAIRNIGIRGEYEDPSMDNLFTFEVTDDDATGLVENVYAAEGSYETDFAFVRKAHEGELTIRNVYLEGWQEGIYGSAPGIADGGGDGPVYIENCYAKNNGVANYRLGSDGSYVRDSVAHVDERTSYSGYSRGVWVRNGGDVEASGMDILLEYSDAGWGVAENDNIETGGVIDLFDSHVDSPGGRGRIDGTVETSDVGDDPDVSVPDAVPESAEDAASR